MQLVDSDEFLKVRFVACIGQTADKIAASLTNSSVECVKCDSLLDATRLCYQKAKNKGGTVLLSPECSSFDMFENYQQRGFVFQQSAKDVSNDKT